MLKSYNPTKAKIYLGISTSRHAVIFYIKFIYVHNFSENFLFSWQERVYNGACTVLSRIS